MPNQDRWCFAWPAFREATNGQTRAAALLASKWPNGSVITVSFLDGDDALRRRVRESALQWTTQTEPAMANLLLDFRKNTHQTEIRISFGYSGSWSVIGTTARNEADTSVPTMNFGWLTPDSSPDELNRVVLHEFGHALGLIHEHQSPDGRICWDRDAVLADLRANGWPDDDIEWNMFHAFEEEETNFGAFDPDSIMMYPIPQRWTCDGFSTNLNRSLSTNDRAFIAKLYPSA